MRTHARTRSARKRLRLPRHRALPPFPSAHPARPLLFLSLSLSCVLGLQEGTRENPIPILSIEENRIVGVSLPDDATIRWFTLKAGELAYDPNTCNWFALKKVSKEEVDEWVQRAEKQVLSGAK